ncbi:TPA: hypothetical protein DEG21_02585 [Patescibacteria group bacterium]|nr:hypothetical protein [Candidatus Gracilibacteria bacterium]HBY74762.1 hypothetical protein [Candidatus Gracilibacteria bacterium]
MAIKNLKIRNILFVNNQSVSQFKGNISINSIFENIKDQIFDSSFISIISDNRRHFIKDSPITFIK